MKHRFETENPHFYRNFGISVIAFFLVACLFFGGISVVGSRTDERAAETLADAVNRGITRCYALEGRYPESLAYLEENYGLVYDTDRFLVDYRPVAGNLRPTVTIIDREAL